MITQTIALFRYQLTGIVNRRLLILLSAILLLAVLLNRFVVELALLHSDAIGLSVMADFLRYSLVLVMLITLSDQIAQDYQTSQFHRLLAMPLARHQYLSAQWLVTTCLAAMLAVPVFVLMWLMSPLSQAGYWGAAVFLELLLVGQFAVLATLNLQKLPLAVMFGLALYLLSKLAPLIAIMLTQSSPIYEEESGFQFASVLFSALQYVLPDANAFARNDLLDQPTQLLSSWLGQLGQVLVYVFFLQMIILFDFYRKEFD